MVEFVELAEAIGFIFIRNTEARVNPRVIEPKGCGIESLSHLWC